MVDCVCVCDAGVAYFYLPWVLMYYLWVFVYLVRERARESTHARTHARMRARTHIQGEHLKKMTLFDRGYCACVCVRARARVCVSGGTPQAEGFDNAL